MSVAKEHPMAVSYPARKRSVGHPPDDRMTAEVIDRIKAMLADIERAPDCASVRWRAAHGKNANAGPFSNYAD
jgi:hypothetical protein